MIFKIIFATKIQKNKIKKKEREGFEEIIILRSNFIRISFRFKFYLYVYIVCITMTSRTGRNNLKFGICNYANHMLQDLRLSIKKFTGDWGYYESRTNQNKNQPEPKYNKDNNIA